MMKYREDGERTAGHTPPTTSQPVWHSEVGPARESYR